MAYAPTIIEIVGSQEFEASNDTPSAILKFVILGVDELYDAYSLVYLTTPNTFQLLNYNNVRLKPLGGGIWEADVMYTRYQSRVPGSLTLAIDFAGAHFKRTHGYAQQYFTPLNPDFDEEEPVGPDNMPNLPSKPFYNAIGVSNDGKIKVEGVDEFVPSFAFTITRVFGQPDFQLTGSFLEAMRTCQRCVNSDPVYLSIQKITIYCAPGELWFIGGTAQVGSDDHSEMVLRFQVEKNLTNATIAGIPGVNKNGWDYLEVYYDEQEDPVTHGLVPVPVQVNVTQTKFYADLNVLFA